MWKRIGKVLTLVFLCAASASALAAGDPEVSIGIDRNSVLLGDSIILTVTVKNDPNPETPEVPDIPGFELRFRGTRQDSFSSVTIIMNGQTVEQHESSGGYRFDYEMTPLEAGMFPISSIEVVYKGKRFYTEPLKIEVLDRSQESDDIFVEVIADKDEVFLGEKILVTFKWYFKKDISGYQIRIPWLDGLKGFLINDPEPEKGRHYQRLVVNGKQEVAALKSTEFRSGQQFTVIQFQKIITPITSGTYELEPVFLKCNVLKGYRKSRRRGMMDSFFDSSFDDFFGFSQRQAVTDPFSTRSNALMITVKEVPGEKRPASYRGAVGSFDFDVEVHPRKLKAGEPITVTMRLSGEGNIEELELPFFPELPDFKSYEPETRTSTRQKDGRIFGESIFERVLVPRTAGAFEIPKIDFTYFDPKERAYRTIGRGPFPVQVAEAPREQEIHVVAMDADRQPARREKQEVRVLKRDIRYIKMGLGAMRRDKACPYESFWVWILGFAIPLLLLILLYRIQGRRERLMTDTAFRRHTVAGKNFSRRMGEVRKLAGKGDGRRFYDALNKALCGYLTDKLNLPGGSMIAECAQELRQRGAEAELISRLSALGTRAEMALFSSMRPEKERLVSDIGEAEEIIGFLERFL